MIEIKNVRGTQETVTLLEVNMDTVYVRTGVIAVDEENFKGWQYDEVQYGKDEFIKIQAEKSDILIQADLANKLAIVEIYESLLV